MSRTRIKFCGMTRREDIDAAVAMGVDAIGLIIAERSPRRLSPAQAERLVAGLPPLVSRVLLSMDSDAALTEDAIAAVRPQYLQFHGSEPADFCQRFGLPYLKAVPMGSLGDDVSLRDYVGGHTGAAGFVLDSHAVGAAGGSGQRFDWSRRPSLAAPWLLAGGLNPDNVAEAITALRPFAVDVSSGIESSPGIKDHAGMRRFIAEVRRADQQNDRNQ